MYSIVELTGLDEPTAVACVASGSRRVVRNSRTGAALLAVGVAYLAPFAAYGAELYFDVSSFAGVNSAETTYNYPAAGSGVYYQGCSTLSTERHGEY